MQPTPAPARISLPDLGDTRTAFAPMSDRDLWQAQWLFRIIGNPTLTKVGSSLSRFGSLGGLVLGPFLGLLARLCLAGVVGGHTLTHAGLVEQAGDAVGRLRADAQPVADAVLGQADAVRVILGEQRVVGADLLKVVAIARAARIGHDDAVIGALLGTATRKTKGYCH